MLSVTLAGLPAARMRERETAKEETLKDGSALAPWGGGQKPIMNGVVSRVDKGWWT
jgi:hypothetical protein